MKTIAVVCFALALLLSGCAAGVQQETTLHSVETTTAVESTSPVTEPTLPWTPVEEELPDAAEYFSQSHPFDRVALLEERSRYLPEPYGILQEGETLVLMNMDTNRRVSVINRTPVQSLCGYDRDWVYAISRDGTQILRMDYLGQEEETVFTDPWGRLQSCTLYQHTLYFVAGVGEANLGVYRLYLPDMSQTLLYAEIPADAVGLGMWPVSAEEIQWYMENPDFTALAEEKRAEYPDLDDEAYLGALELDFEVRAQIHFYYNAATGQLARAEHNTTYNTNLWYTPEGEVFFDSATGDAWWNEVPNA